MLIFDPTDEEILATLTDPEGISTTDVAKALGAPLAVSQVYRRLLKMREAGSVELAGRPVTTNVMHWRRPRYG